MSYAVTYTMKVKGIKDETELHKLLAELKDTGDLEIIFELDKRSVTYNTRSHTANIFSYGEYGGWTEPQNTFRDRISRKYPDMTFAIFAQGEERDDNMVYLIHNGEMDKLFGRLVFTKPRKIAWKGDLTIWGV